MATVTPQYSWPVPTSTDYVKDGATAIESLGDAVDATLYTALGGAYPGLRLVKKQTIGTGVSSVTVTNAFSATYDNYKIIVSGGSSSGDAYLGMKLGASTTAYYEFMFYGSFSSASVFGANTNNNPSWIYTGDAVGSQSLFMNVDLFNPFLAKYTRYGNNMAYQSGTGSGQASGIHRVATSYTDLVIAPNTGTITGGTIYVYGYGAS
jgi:hypothetical protein